MIVDADCHISPLRERNHIPADELLRMMDRAGVDKALVWLVPPYEREIDESNAYMCAAMYDALLDGEVTKEEKVKNYGREYEFYPLEGPVNQRRHEIIAYSQIKSRADFILPARIKCYVKYRA